MRRRTALLAGTVLGVGALAVAGLAVLGSVSTTTTGADGWTGWTGKVDTAAVADKAAMTPDDAVAVALLARSARAASSVAYVGRAVTWDRAGTTTMLLTHLPGRGTVATPISPAGPARFAPEGRSGSFADDGRPLALLRDNYRVLRQADLDTTVAGRPADAVVAVAADGTLDARFWLDHATGLLLRRELLDVKGLVRSRTGFETLRLGIPDDTVVPAGQKDPWSEQVTPADLPEARAEGCPCPESLPGGLALLETRRAPAGTVSSTPVVHQLFSDGVASVSLFSVGGGLSDADVQGLQTRGFRLESLDGRSAWVRGGTAAVPTLTAVWACPGYVLTLVTDDAQDPRTTAAAVLAALPPASDASDSSLWAQVLRGWHRLVGGAS